jgi:hypothetical protein
VQCSPCVRSRFITCISVSVQSSDTQVILVVELDQLHEVVTKWM